MERRLATRSKPRRGTARLPKRGTLRRFTTLRALRTTGWAWNRTLLLPFSYFGKPTEAGYDASQWRLGMHLSAEEKSKAEGIAWLKRAASQGHLGAFDQLARLQDKSDG